MSVSTSSGLLSASASVPSAGDSGRLKQVVINGGSAASTVTVYDTNTGTASGTVLYQLVMPTSQSYGGECDVAYTKGIYVAISGAGAAAVVHTVRG